MNPISSYVMYLHSTIESSGILLHQAYAHRAFEPGAYIIMIILSTISRLCNDLWDNDIHQAQVLLLICLQYFVQMSLKADVNLLGANELN